MAAPIDPKQQLDIGGWRGRDLNPIAYLCTPTGYLPWLIAQERLTALCCTPGVRVLGNRIGSNLET